MKRMYHAALPSLHCDFIHFVTLICSWGHSYAFFFLEHNTHKRARDNLVIQLKVILLRANCHVGLSLIHI